mgnify:FL=1
MSCTNSITAPFSEDFEAGVPPANWLVINSDNLEGWESTTTTDINGNSSKVARMDNYQYNAPGALDYLVTPDIDLTPYCDPMLIFEVAYAAYGADNFEQLEVLYSNDCGINFEATGYAKADLELATVGYQGNGWAPSDSSHWRTDTVALSAFVSENTILTFVQTAGYGNGLFLSLIHI